ncbi:Protein C2-DOMAIN ABA-RELATED 7 [Ancistrocladus abbreviatus]
MEHLMGLLRIRVRRGRNLPVHDTRSSDPYVLVTMGTQKLKTRTVKDNCNPEWNDELTLAVSDPDAPITLMVYDKDTFTKDDKMGEANIDIKPYLDCVKAGIQDLPTGTVASKEYPNQENCLADVSQIVSVDGKLVQDMTLRLKKASTGEVEVQIEWIDVPGSRGLSS